MTSLSSPEPGSLRGRNLAGADGVFAVEDLEGRILSGGGAGVNGTCELPMLPNALGGKTTGKFGVVVGGGWYCAVGRILVRTI